LLPYELEQLREWLFDFIIEKPELTMLIDSRAINTEESVLVPFDL
jgi:hypothetical protein